MAVVRVSTLEVPRLVRNPPPPPPMPRPPPSDFCRSTAPIRASTIIRWITITTVSIASSSLQEAKGAARRRHQPRSYRKLRGSLHDPPGYFQHSRGTAEGTRGDRG